jgi:hypothetical protein
VEVNPDTLEVEVQMFGDRGKLDTPKKMIAIEAEKALRAREAMLRNLMDCIEKAYGR